ncbi:hypothetical protein GRF29_28g342805 [Pseudopithomyces chartarum]|uniref:Cytochrome P450 n=1 Tax=Pseudopithomyces chartarum TaxID=1892770 RepID=A0AAN6M3R9_9PLEO|nr:hypothetical protein GRF29_28g342805 [Pseudopithomyces chartarum]
MALPQLSLINALAFLFTTCLLTTLLYALSNLYLHPLRRFPGPLLNASFHLPYVTHNIRGTLPSHVLSLHQKYGPIVRISPNQLAFTDPAAWPDIYGLQPGRVQNKKDQAAYTPPADEMFDGATGIIHAGDGAHARLRRIYGQAFTPKAIEGLAGMLVKNLEVLEKVKKEVRTAFEQEDEITPTTVDDLEYMIAVLSEGLRIFPPTGFGFPRIISSKGGQNVAGHWIPEQTRCSVFHHAAYRYEGNFARAEEFIPERWLANAPAEFRDDKRDVVQPFMVGPRGCIGKSLAHAEMRLLLAKMLYNFDFELAGPELWHEKLRSYLIWERTPLLIRLKNVQR